MFTLFEGEHLCCVCKFQKPWVSGGMDTFWMHFFFGCQRHDPNLGVGLSLMSFASHSSKAYMFQNYLLLTTIGSRNLGMCSIKLSFHFANESHNTLTLKLIV